MPKSNATLSNCYTPLPASSSKSKRSRQTINPGARPTGDPDSKRNSKSIRRLCIDRHTLSSSTGSSLIELGNTKVLCSVHGPKPITSSSTSSSASNAASQSKDIHSEGILNCQIRYAPHFGIRPETKMMLAATNLDGYGPSSSMSSTAISAQEVELSSRLLDAISPSVPLQLLMKNVVDVFVMVLQDDGAVFSASVIAASLALADAGVEIYDLVTSFTVAVIPKSIVTIHSDNSDTAMEIDGNEENNEDKDEDALGISKSNSDYHLLADPNEKEMLLAKSIVTIAMMKNWKEVVFWDQIGKLPPSVATEASELCREGCAAMHKFMRQALIGKDGNVN